ncbi:sulfur carrier protein ThiS [Pseudophaeobacter sp.]|uniref:sulfur carrier protein ThiS n=1 Tax=Pseudophaeobacter sp. TaxID=1971739 RepID=UPI004057CEEB
MIISVNAERHEIQSTTLEQTLVELGFHSPALATAVNGSFVSRAKRGETQLNDGDRIEILAPMQGG